MRYFAYKAIAREAGIPHAKLDELRALAEQEFPNDPIMVELHLLRVYMAVRDGVLNPEEALRPEPARN